MKILLKLIPVVIMSIIIPCSAYAAVQQINSDVKSLNIQQGTPSVPFGMNINVAYPAVSLPSGVTEAILKPNPSDGSTNGYVTREMSWPYLLSYGYRDSMGDHWAMAGVDLKVKSGDQLIVTLWTPDAPVIRTSFSTDISIADIYTIDKNQKVGTLLVQARNWGVKVDTCVIKTGKNLVVHWPDITPSDIMTGSVSELQTPITYNCLSPVSVIVTVTSNNGGTGNVINTSLAGLGIKLGWVNNKSTVINLNGPYTYHLPAGDSDFSVSAIPVHVGSAPISGGNFTSAATVSFQYN